MNIAFLTYGTRGDIQPFLAIAIELRALGHHVRFGANENFSSWIEESGFDFFPIRGDFQKIFESKEGQSWLASRNIKKLISKMRDLGSSLRLSIQDDCFDVCNGTDLIVATALTFRFGLTLSEKLGIPMVIALTFPIFPETTAFPHPLVSSIPIKFQFRNLNLFTHRIFKKLSWTKRDMKGTLEWRNLLGLKSLSENILDTIYNRKVPILHLISGHLIPKPSEWTSENILVGTPVLSVPIEETEQMRNLKRWIIGGSAPIYLGFGSMPILDPRRMVEMVRKVSVQTGRRFVLCAGWTEFEGQLDSSYPDTDTVIFIREANHDWLFPKCSTIVHHGGVGTTMAAIRSGRPSIVFSVFMDQPFWGMILERQGLGVHFRFQNLNESTLKKGIFKAESLNINDQNEIVRSLRNEKSSQFAAKIISNFGKPF